MPTEMQPATPTLESVPLAVAHASPRQPRPEPLTTHWLRGGSTQPETSAERLAAPSSTTTPALSPKSTWLRPLKPSVPLPIGISPTLTLPSTRKLQGV